MEINGDLKFKNGSKDFLYGHCEALAFLTS